MATIAPRPLSELNEAAAEATEQQQPQPQDRESEIYQPGSQEGIESSSDKNSPGGQEDNEDNSSLHDGDGDGARSPLAKRQWHRTTFFNVTVLGMCSFLAPGIWGAMNSLGAGGAEKPYLVNAANALTFSLMVVSCFFGSAFVHAVGIKYALLFGTAGYAPFAAGLYTNNRFGTEWLVLFGAATCGICAGVFWMAEGAIILGYPEKNKRGKYLAYWLAYRVGGQILGGAINLALNAHQSQVGKVGYNTFLVMIALQCLGPFVGMLLSPPHKVQRKDGTPVRLSMETSFRKEVKETCKLFMSRDMLLITPLIIQTTFSEAFNGTYLTLYFTVRARALGSFLSAFTAIFSNFVLGTYLDNASISLNVRAKTGFILVWTLQGAWWIWSMIIQKEYWDEKPQLDWDSPGFGRGFALYIFLVTGFNMMYNYTYFLVGSLVSDPRSIVRISSLLRGLESAGQAVSYGLTSTTFTMVGESGVNMGLWAVSLVPAWLVVKDVGLRRARGDEGWSQGGEGEAKKAVRADGEA